MNREPALTVGSVTAVATALLALLVAFGLHLDDAQRNAILGFLAVAAPVVGAVLTRPKVTPVSDPKSDAGAPLVPAAPPVE